MEISIGPLYLMFANAFDIIEADLAGASKYHSWRVASLCARMGKHLCRDEESFASLFTCALFHDNALTEYAMFHRASKNPEIDLRMHCEDGQRNIEWLPLTTDVSGYILHHHSCENGKGPFGVREFPPEAAIIGVADIIDVAHHLQREPLGGLGALRDRIAARIGTLATKTAVEALLAVLDAETMESLRDENIHATVARLSPAWKAQMENTDILRLSRYISHIIDCKSQFTRKHSEQIANRAWIMSGFYGYAEEEKASVYLAASLHDIGKIATPIAVLEKPGKLTLEEYHIIMDHVRYTHEWLSGVEGLGQIREWASAHHEKLDGSGYPFGKRGEDLDFNSRLLCCLDIYQAVCEDRPYHPAREHTITMPILRGMMDRGWIDGAIVQDLDEAMAQYSMRELPLPVL